MSPLRVLRGFIFGGLGGALGWVLVELFFNLHRLDGMKPPPPTYPQDQGLIGAVLGLAIGTFLGVSEGISEGTASRFRRAFFTFMGVGVVGGFIGLYFGQIFFAKMGGRVDTNELAFRDFFPQLLARGLGWALLGLFLGLSLGIPNLSFRRMWNGAVGGGLGGFLAGAMFQLMSYTGLFQGTQGRLVGFIILGAVVGFFINLIAEALKKVWVKVLIGRNEGREHEIDTPLAYVGRDELADVPVFLDPAVPKRMASFRLNQGRYALYPESDKLQIVVNGQPLTPGQVLRDGDAIQFGRVTLGYYEKATATGSVRPLDSIALADFSTPSVVPGATPIPTGQNVCSFCGQQKDANGNCACTVPDGGYAPAPGGYDPSYGQPMDPGYGAPAYGGVPSSMGYGQPMQDPAYAATMMDPGYGAAPVPAAGSGPRLVAVEGPYTGQVFPLYSESSGIGRDPAQEVPLSSDGTASRRHARVLYSNGSWFVRDEGSSNGTWVNGVRISEQPLFPGDTIRVGGTHLRFDA